MVGAGRLERLLRPVHQRPAQRDRAHRAVPRRGAAAGRHRVRAHPAGARHRAAARATCSTPTSPTSSAKKEGRTDVTAMPYGPSVPHMFIVVFVIMLPMYLADQGPDARLAGRAGLVLHHRRHRAARRVRRAVDPQATRRARRCSARWPASRSRSSRCGRRSRCGRCRGSRSSRFAIVLIAWTANMRLPGGVPGGLVAVIVGHRRSAGSRRVRRLERLHGGRRRSAGSFEQFGLHLPLFSGRRLHRPGATSRRCSPPRSRSASTTSPRR